MLNIKASTFEHAELMEALRGCVFLKEYRLMLYCTYDGAEVPEAGSWQLCAAIDPQSVHPCVTTHPRNEVLELSVVGNRPAVILSSTGLYFFAVPLPDSSKSRYCIIGHGVREKRLNLQEVESLAYLNKINPFTIMEQLERLAVANLREVEDTAEKVHRLLPTLTKKVQQRASAAQTLDRLEAVAGICMEMDKVDAATDAFILFTDTLTILFDIPKFGMALTKTGHEFLNLKQISTYPCIVATIPTETLQGYGHRGRPGKCFLLKDGLDSLFPAAAVEIALCIPLYSGGESLGIVALFNTEARAGETALLELLATRLATKIMQLRKEEELYQANALSGKMLEMINTMSLMEDDEELHHSVLNMAANLVQAASGSLMLVDGNGEDMHIASVLGMNLQIARGIKLKVGEGIAGKVAAGGRPLMVNDIENDARVGTGNRPRFKTNSFVCIPLKFKQQTLGVLNLADKENDRKFTEEDLDVLTRFGIHAAAMIKRTHAMERSEILEQLALSDPLTEVYNRRFLTRRLKEELNRSRRLKEQLTVMMIDLDNFGRYNDLCGYGAGDRALKRIAGILKNSVREMDVVARYEGEEFCIILTGTAKMESLFVAERIRRSIEKEMFPGEEELPAERLTASMGISSFPEDGNNYTTLINTARKALCQAKKAGRNRIVIFHDAEEQQSSSKLIQQQG